MRVMILGATGLLGRELMKQLSKTHHVEAVPRAVLDARDIDNAVVFRIALHNFQPDVVINCIGIVKSKCSNAVEAIEVNALFPHKLTALLEAYGSKLIHISTDCVYDTDLYGRTKLLGESHAHMTIRTSFIGRHPTDKSGLLEWFLSRTAKFADGFTGAAYWGLTTIEVARAIEAVLAEGSVPAGVWEVGGPPITKYDLLGLLAREYNTGTIIVPHGYLRSNKVLDSTAFNSRFNYRAPSWVHMIREMVHEYPR